MGLTGACIALVGALGGAAGIGGGGLNVPLLMMLMGVPIKRAVKLSHTAVLGTMIAQNFVNLQRRHPELDQPLIDFIAPLLLLPALLAGCAIGVSLSPVFPAGVLIMLSTVLLLWASKQMWAKAQNLRREENARRVSRPTLHQSLLAASVACESAIDPTLLSTSLPRVSLGVPWEHVLALFGFVVLFCADFIVLGGDVHVPFLPTVRSCSPAYWATLLAVIPIGVASVAYGVVTVRRLGWKSAEELVPPSDDAQWTEAETSAPRYQLQLTWSGSVLKLPLLTACIGIAAGLLGVGGGEIITPLCVMLGMPTQVAAATSCFIILFSEFSNFVHYMSTGALQPIAHCASILATCASFGALCGRALSIVAQRQGRSSALVYVLGFVLALSTAFMVAHGVRDHAFDVRHWHFGPLCHHADDE